MRFFYRFPPPINSKKKTLTDSLMCDPQDATILDLNASNEDMEKIALKFVNFHVIPPPEAKKFLNVPHVQRGFANSCSECSAESVIRYWQLQGYKELLNWNQFTMHRQGFATFEGQRAEGDRGLYALFTLLNLVREEKTTDNLNDLKLWIDKGIPLIVRITTDPFRVNHHTQVLIGYSDNELYLNDNDIFESRNPHFRTIPNQVFLRGFTGKYLVVYPKKFQK